MTGEPPAPVCARSGSRGGRAAKDVPLGELPPYLVNAFIATEDRRFYEHGAVELRSILRAALANLSAGGFVQGGSTITQQLAKNLYLDNARTLWRKAQEALNALNVAYEYFAPLPYRPAEAAEADYLPFGKAA